MNSEIPGHCAGYAPIDPARALAESEPVNPWPTQAGARRQMVVEACREEADGSAAMLGRALTVLAALAVLSFVAAGGWAIAGLWR